MASLTKKELIELLQDAHYDIAGLKDKLTKAKMALELISQKMGRAIDDSQNLYSAVIIAQQALKELNKRKKR